MICRMQSIASDRRPSLSCYICSMIRRKRLRLGSHERDLMNSLTLGDVTVAFLLSAHSTSRFYRLARERAMRRQQTNRALSRLEQKGLVRIFSRKGEDIVCLSEQGRSQIDKAVAELQKQKASQTWDGLWHLVTFDIPERFRSSRNALRSVLRMAGFEQVQQSVYVHSSACGELIELLQKDPVLSERVVYVVVKTYMNDRKLRKKFHLPQARSKI